MIIHHMESAQMIAASNTGLGISKDEADDSEGLVKGNGLYDSSSFDFEW